MSDATDHSNYSDQLRSMAIAGAVGALATIATVHWFNIQSIPLGASFIKRSYHSFTVISAGVHCIFK